MDCYCVCASNENVCTRALHTFLCVLRVGEWLGEGNTWEPGPVLICVSVPAGHTVPDCGGTCARNFSPAPCHRHRRKRAGALLL